MLNNQAEFKNKTHMGLSKRRVITGKIAEIVFFLCAVISIITTVGIVVSLLSQSLYFFFEVTLWEFLTGTRWAPIL